MRVFSISFFYRTYIPVRVSYAVCAEEEFQEHLALIHPILQEEILSK